MKWYNFNTDACRQGQRVLLRFKRIPVGDGNAFNLEFPRDYLIGTFDYDHSEYAQIQFWDVGELCFRWNEDYFDAWSPLPDLNAEPVAFVSESEDNQIEQNG